MTNQIMSQPAVRGCAVCATPFPTDPRNPARTYCSHRCRNTAWRRRRATTATGTRPAVEACTPTGRAGADGATAVQQCPHCHRPMVLITLITTPAAAHVTVPDPPTLRAGFAATGPGTTP